MIYRFHMAFLSEKVVDFVDNPQILFCPFFCAPFSFFPIHSGDFPVERKTLERNLPKLEYPQEDFFPVVYAIIKTKNFSLFGLAHRTCPHSPLLHT